MIISSIFFAICIDFIDFCLTHSLCTLTGVKQAATTSFPPFHFALLTHLWRLRPYSAQARPAHAHKASRTSTVIGIRVVSCNPHVLTCSDKTTENSVTTHNTLTLQLRHGNLHWSLPFKTGHHWAGIQLCFCGDFSVGAFVCFWTRNSQRVVGSSGGPFECWFPLILLLGGAAFSSLLCVVMPFLLFFFFKTWN